MDTTNGVQLGVIFEATDLRLYVAPELHALMVAHSYGRDERLHSLRRDLCSALRTEINYGDTGPEETVLRPRVFLPWSGSHTLTLGCALTPDEHVYVYPREPLPAMPMSPADWRRLEREAGARFQAEWDRTHAAPVAAPTPAPTPVSAPEPLPEIGVRTPCPADSCAVAQVTDTGAFPSAYAFTVEFVAPEGAPIVRGGAEGPIAGLHPRDARSYWVEARSRAHRWEIWTYTAGSAERRKALKRMIKEALRTAGYRVLPERANILAEHKRVYPACYGQAP